MRKKSWLYLSFLLVFSGTNFISTPTIKSAQNDKNASINIEYLNQLPKNDYIIGPGDRLKILVSREYPELTTEATVDGEGTIYLPRLNRIFVSGLNISELNKVLTEAFKKFVKYPLVEVQILAYRPIRVLVDGEVENPGLKILEGSFSLVRQSEGNFGNEAFGNVPIEILNQGQNNSVDKVEFYFPTVFDAIRQSGGITRYSDLSNVQIIRKNNISGGGGQITTTLNFQEVITQGNNSQNIRIYDSDIIRIKKSNKENDLILRKAVLSNLNPKFINVFVSGRVNFPGNIKLSRASTLTDAISMSGDTKALKGPLTFIRFNNDGTIDKRKFGLRKNAKRGSFKNPVLKNGDFIFVGNSLLTRTNEVITEVTSPIVGIFSTYGLLKVLND